MFSQPRGGQSQNWRFSLNSLSLNSFVTSFFYSMLLFQLADVFLLNIVH